MTTNKTISLGDVESAISEFNREFPRPKLGPPFSIVDDYVSSSFPNAASAGVYFIFDRDDNLLYIGKADGLGARLGSHFGWNTDRTAGRVKNQKLLAAHAVRTIGLPDESRFEAPAIEAFLIRRLDPTLNVIGRDLS
ncbi:GIY-YIG nuclease family protein [Paraburkholderia youngii]|uniref:GIY-YIG nuclease family protein n=1 Tax=Paraburkholderia youngii TaxID=2782701 RepID=A0A7Y6K4T5_9BURK|nr:GIY-YIG nuclease family protein [Paraburkholderia youngii]NUY04360.1 GIY-YIG nuclease family protein [Paraburkholderia youngii]